MAPVIPAPCWASRHLMPGVPSQPAKRQLTPPAVRRPPRRNRHLEAVAPPVPPSRAPRRRTVRSPAVGICQGQPIRRSCSEPALLCWSRDDEAGDATESLPRFSSYTDVCSPDMVLSPPPSTSPSPTRLPEGAAAAAGGKGRYTEESKVVVSVTVEGSPGPVRALVRLGATVEETIATVAGIYRKEGRCPRLEDAGGCEEGSLELYHSYFCLQGLNKSDRLGDVGGRTFYLRRSSTSASSFSQSASGELGPPSLLGGSHSCLIVSFLMKRLSKIARRGRKIWNMLGCIASD